MPPQIAGFRMGLTAAEHHHPQRHADLRSGQVIHRGGQLGEAGIAQRKILRMVLVQGCQQAW